MAEVASSKKVIVSVISGCALVVFLSAGCGILFGAIWGLIDWLRLFGSGTSPFPYLDPSPFPIELPRHYAGHPILGPMEDALAWYIMAVRGAARFGSGVGIIFGAIYALDLIESYPSSARYIAGFVAGSIVGGRAVIMFGYYPGSCLVGMLIGGLVAVLITALDLHDRKIPPLRPVGS